MASQMVQGVEIPKKLETDDKQENVGYRVSFISSLGLIQVDIDGHPPFSIG
jgi:hypothetical protein